MMTPELAYFLKINVAIALFYAFYRLFFYKDTFFHYTSGTNHHSTARTNNELARVNHTLFENHLLEWSISINNTFPCAIRQYHTATYPVP